MGLVYLSGGHEYISCSEGESYPERAQGRTRQVGIFNRNCDGQDQRRITQPSFDAGSDKGRSGNAKSYFQKFFKPRVEDPEIEELSQIVSKFTKASDEARVKILSYLQELK